MLPSCTTRQTRYLFVYDDDEIDFISDATGYGIEPNDEFAREAFYAVFRTRNYNFCLMTIYTGLYEVATEIPVLKVVYEDLQNKTPNEDD